MYLEISPRSSGKTARLINAVFNCVEYAKKAMIIVSTKDHVIPMRKRATQALIPPEVQIITAFAFRHLESITPGTFFFFDDFDQYGFGRNFNIMSFVFPNNGYYVTTATFLRPLDTIMELKDKKIPTDLLIQLLRCNNGTYTSIIPPNSTINHANLRAQIREEWYRTQILGQFIDYNKLSTDKAPEATKP